MTRRILLGLILSTSLAQAEPANWGNCMPLAAGSCATSTDLAVTGTLRAAAVTPPAGPLVIGGSATTSITLSTDGTGSGEVVLPNDAIGSLEVSDASLIYTDMSLTAATLAGNPTNGDSSAWIATTGLIFEGTASDTNEGIIEAPTIGADRTWTLPDVTGTIITTGDTSTVSATIITDLTRMIPLPLGSWVPCGGAVPGVWDVSGVDVEPDLTVFPTGALSIAYDDTAGTIDTGTICNSFTVPGDYISTGRINYRVMQDAATGANIEAFGCALSINGAALGAVTSANLTNQTATQFSFITPAGTWSANSSVQVVCAQTNVAADDIVYIQAISAQYTASQ